MISSIPSAFDPLGTLNLHPFPLPSSLTNGLIDAAIQGKSCSYFNHTVSDTMTMDSNEVADLLLETQTLIVKIGSENKTSRVIISNDFQSIDSYAILKGLAF